MNNSVFFFFLGGGVPLSHADCHYYESVTKKLGYDLLEKNFETVFILKLLINVTNNYKEIVAH